MQQPAPACDPYFDESRGEWILSRYRDVMAALREPQLWPPGSGRDDAGRLLLRGPSQDALASARVGEWERQIAPLAHRMLDALPSDRPVDLLANYALPWCFEVALLVVQAAPEMRDRLAALSAEVFAATGAPDDSDLKLRAAAATEELVRIFENGPIPMGEPTFVAISQTSPRMLAGMWLALYCNPAEAARLREHPELWPAAAEELMRYAGIVRRIRREARGGVSLAGVTIGAGQRVSLLLASANRDPEQFPDPQRLDVSRQVSGQVALGMGRNSCAGAALVRGMIAISTRVLLERFPTAHLAGAPEWRMGSGYCFPVSVPAQLFT